jgi:hypothetical protein
MAVGTFLIVVVVLVVLAVAGLAALRALGLDPQWLARTRHALGEASYRTRGVLVEFGDWLRLGR